MLISALIVSISPILILASLPVFTRLRERWYISKLDSPDATARAAAARKLGDLQSRKAIPKLIELMRDTSGSDPYAASLVLIAKAAVPDITQQLSNPDHKRRRNVLLVLTKLGPVASSAVPEVLDIMADGDLYPVARDVILSLGDHAIPALAAQLKSNYRQRRANAARALGTLGDPARGALPDLIEALSDGDLVVRLAAASAVISLDPSTKDRRVFEALGRSGKTRVNRVSWAGRNTNDSRSAPRFLGLLDYIDCSILTKADEAFISEDIDVVNRYSIMVNEKKIEMRRDGEPLWETIFENQLLGIGTWGPAGVDGISAAGELFVLNIKTGEVERYTSELAEIVEKHIAVYNYLSEGKLDAVRRIVTEDVDIVDSEVGATSGPLNVGAFKRSRREKGKVKIRLIRIFEFVDGLTVVSSDDVAVLHFRKGGEGWQVVSGRLASDF